MSAHTGQQQFDQRIAEFHQDYGNGHDFEGDDLISCVISAGRFLSAILGPDLIDGMMARLCEELGYRDLKTPAEWEQHLAACGPADAFGWHLGAKFRFLNAYGYRGIYIFPDSPVRSREEILGTTITEVAAFMRLVPSEWNVTLRDSLRTLTAAQARWALDRDEPVTPEGLALLGGVAPRTVANLASSGVLRKVGGMIPIEDARLWLAERREFMSSAWRENAPSGDRRAEAEPLADVYFVPVAKDGSTFHPNCRMNGFFRIGDPEELVADFREALTKLQQSPAPSWKRRKRPDGNWGRVHGFRWERRTIEELKAIADMASHVG